MPPAYQSILREICEGAGATAMRYWGQSQQQRKADGSIVTDADKACEDYIVEALSRIFPEDGIVSEEGALKTGKGRTWYVDPIDGTSSFVDGLAHWGPTLGLAEAQEFIVGAFWQPRIEEFWFSQATLGAFRNDRRIIRTETPLPGPNSPLYGPSGLHRLQPIPWPGKLRALGATAAHLALVACTPGSVAFVPRWQMWDIVNGILMVELSGGVITDLGGQPWHPLRDGHKPFLAGSQHAIQHLTQKSKFFNDVRRQTNKK